MKHKAWVASASLEDVLCGPASTDKWELGALDLRRDIQRLEVQAPSRAARVWLHSHDVGQHLALLTSGVDAVGLVTGTWLVVEEA